MAQDSTVHAPDGHRTMVLQPDILSRSDHSEDQRAAMRDEFVSRAAYAIRSPVNIILGYSELIAQRLLALGDDSQQPYIDGIRRSGRQILSAVSRILDYASIEQGTLRISPERIHLAGLL